MACFVPFVARLFGRVFVALNFDFNMVRIIEVTGVADPKGPEISLWASVDFIAILLNTLDNGIVFILIERESNVVHSPGPLLSCFLL